MPASGPPPPRRLKTRYVVGLISLVAGVVAAWFLWAARPLNETEQKLVGVWTAPGRGQWTFSEDRRVTFMGISAAWDAEDSILSISPGVLGWASVEHLVKVARKQAPSFDLEFDGPDRIYISGVEYHRDSAGELEWKTPPSTSLPLPNWTKGAAP